MPSLVLDIVLPAHRLTAVYQGRANRILVTSREGRSVSLPVHHLRPYVTREGIRGSFRLDFSEDGHLLGLTRLA
ncbi:DUF2835 domain-containing protein [Stutzerimonas azotifigens]|uniref:DUF2835 domain-containing protein n=1 Tax=Stutzerimonas azotifigens TaxID=291995 RepID=UPI0003FA53FB|nr:DUF2835 domain-containing protein [Stutzerimonas azotifigens]